MAWVAEPPGARAPIISVPIQGTIEAPLIARSTVLSRLEGRVTETAAHDIALLVGELVTNSVLHSDVRADDTVLVEVSLDGDRLEISVTDPGSELEPQMLPRDPTRPHGFGLRLVDEISSDWGVRRQDGGTQVWCELPLAAG